MKQIIRLCPLFLLLLILPVHPDQDQDVWQPLRFLEGTWTGQGDGMSGASQVTQSYVFILNTQFLQMKTLSEFKPQEKNPEGEIHEDLGLFSYDTSRKKFDSDKIYLKETC